VEAQPGIVGMDVSVSRGCSITIPEARRGVECVILHSIAVVESERRQGKATSAIRQLIQEARDQEAGFIRVEAVWNWRLEKLLEKEGFERCQAYDGGNWDLRLVE